MKQPYDLNRLAEHVTCAPPATTTFEYDNSADNPAAKIMGLFFFKSQSSQRLSDGEQQEPAPHDQRGTLFSNFSYGHGQCP
jgi:hypothetical protein